MMSGGHGDGCVVTCMRTGVSPWAQAAQRDTVALDRRDAPRAARRLVAAGCTRASSEVVTNAVRHGTGDIMLGFLAGSLLALVEVGDGDVRTPQARAVLDDDEGGWGLQIVTALASGWGVRDRQPGKLVRVTVPARP